MKKQIYLPYFLWAFILFLCLPNSVEAKQEEVSKTIEKTFTVNKDAKLVLSNQFGKIDLINHEKNEVEILIKIRVETSSREKAQKKLDQIKVDISGSATLVDVKTNFEKSRGNFNGEFSVDYTIKAPSSMTIDLRNQFGDVFVGEWTGSTNIDVQYGSLTVGKLNGESNEVDLQFSKGSIGLINKGNVELAYVDRFNLDRAKELVLRSSFSNVEIETIEKLDCHSEYDEVEIGEVNRIELDASFSSVEIGTLFVKGDLENEYGSIKVQKVSKGFEGLNIENSFASIKVYFEKGSQFTFECEAEYGDISVPSGAVVNIDRKDHSDHYLKGTYGSGSELPHVSVEVDYGGARLDIE